jgi:hypothetical protein
MGWENRDWARLNDGELERLYGIRPSRKSSKRGFVWGALSVLTVLVIGFAFSQRPRPFVAPPTEISSFTAPLVVYGGQTAHLADERLVCTAEAVNFARRVWECQEWSILGAQQVAALAVGTGGVSCTSRHVDQRSRRWVCDRIITPPAGLTRPPRTAHT